MQVPGITPSTASTPVQGRRASTASDGAVFRLPLASGAPGATTTSTPTTSTPTSSSPTTSTTATSPSPTVPTSSLGSTPAATPATGTDPLGSLVDPSASDPNAIDPTGAGTIGTPTTGGATGADGSVAAGTGSIGTVHLSPPAAKKKTPPATSAGSDSVGATGSAASTALARELARIESHAAKVETLKNGAKLYHLAGGRLVEALPGHTPYVVQAGDAKLWHRARG